MPEAPTPADLPLVFSHAEARRHGVSNRRLYGWRDTGSIEQLGRGLFRRAGAEGDPDLAEIAYRAPDATLCLGSALARHHLTDEIPASIDLALPRRRRPPRTAAPVTWHRFEEATYTIGRREIRVTNDLKLGLYGPARSIIDAFRFRHLEGQEQAIEALRRWLRQPRSKASEILGMLRHFPAAEKSIRAALEILL